MIKKNIVVIGGGFAGTNVVKILSENRRRIENYNVVLIDRKNNFEFIPMLPDILGGWLPPESIQTSFITLAREMNFEYRNDCVNRIDIDNRKIYCDKGTVNYEYLVLASGVDANYFGNKNAKKNCLKFKEVSNIPDLKQRLIEKANKYNHANIVIIGGGYTGLEVATNAKLFIKSRNITANVIIVEKSDSILPMLSDRLKKHADNTLARRGIKVETNDSLKKYDGNTVKLKSSKIIQNAVCIWTVGTKTADFVHDLDMDKLNGRIKVDQNLLIEDQKCKKCFAIGDVASFIDPNTQKPLRMAIMFAIKQGKIAGKNIINLISDKPLKKYKPKDLGYLIPLAFKKAPGNVLGFPVGPKSGYILHYLMCIYRARKSNKYRILKTFLTKRLFKHVTD
ncbi:MAG: FAD-dependent oxidoreductase [Candidatus Marinimicrobia bacterium]|nr:FAD-dependent oxidoreductase [Candidatus Neomarinimicrobiota bacterium]